MSTTDLPSTSQASTLDRVASLNRTVVAHRVVQTGILLTLIWKWKFFVASSAYYGRIPLSDAFFPEWLQSVWCVRAAFLGTILAVGLNLVTRSQRCRVICAAIALGGTSILCIHQASYNDMTFVTAWWTCLWAIWYVRRMDDDNKLLTLRRASLLSRLIISVILLGGAAGKWTSEYWSGEVFYDIYFVDRDYWVFNLLRSWFDPEQLRSIAMWYSRKVVVLETAAGLGLWMLPPKIAAAAGIVILTSIALLSNFLLFSVLFALIGLAAVGLLVPPSKEPQRSDESVRSD